MLQYKLVGFVLVWGGGLDVCFLGGWVAFGVGFVVCFVVDLCG